MLLPLTGLLLLPALALSQLYPYGGGCQGGGSSCGSPPLPPPCGGGSCSGGLSPLPCSGGGCSGAYPPSTGGGCSGGGCGAPLPYAPPGPMGGGCSGGGCGGGGGGGGGCSGGGCGSPPFNPPFPPPLPCPRCPAPPPCPPQFCPPPPICPPPPPPVPCPVALPPPIPVCPPRPPCPPPQMALPPPPCGGGGGIGGGCGGGMGGGPGGAYGMIPGGGCGGGGCAQNFPLPAQNDCCCNCRSPCRFKRRRFAAAMGVRSLRDQDASCNSETLRRIIRENATSDVSESKRQIQKAAQEALGSRVDVICGRGEFSYVVHTDSFCQETVADVTCYAFKPL